jgi:hypothetical protein
MFFAIVFSISLASAQIGPVDDQVSFSGKEDSFPDNSNSSMTKFERLGVIEKGMSSTLARISKLEKRLSQVEKELKKLKFKWKHRSRKRKVKNSEGSFRLTFLV